MPAQRVVDTHVHIFDTERFRYPWLDGAPDALRRPHLLEQYRTATKDHVPAAWVFEEVCVEDSSSLAEVEWIIRETADDPTFAGVVAQVVLEDPTRAEAELDALAATGRLLGVRRVIQFQSDPDFVLRDDFIRGLKLLPSYGVPFDIGTDRSRLQNVITCVRQCPEVSFVLNHLGKPGIADSEFNPWRSQIRELAAEPNVICQMSGLLTESGSRGTREGVRPYFDHIVEQFGFSKLMYGSDWPIQEPVGGLGKQLDLIDELLTGCSASELEDFWAGTAERTYSITRAPHAGRKTARL